LVGSVVVGCLIVVVVGGWIVFTLVVGNVILVDVKVILEVVVPGDCLDNGRHDTVNLFVTAT
jgi:hypothetical protein